MVHFGMARFAALYFLKCTMSHTPVWIALRLFSGYAVAQNVGLEATFGENVRAR